LTIIKLLLTAFELSKNEVNLINGEVSNFNDSNTGIIFFKTKITISIKDYQQP
jgi:hypothetical protein